MSSASRRLRRFAVAALALACLSPSTSLALPALPPLPELLGLVPEPTPAPAASPAFAAQDSGVPVPPPEAAPPAKPVAPGAQPAQAPADVPGRPPVTSEADAGATAGSALPVLPPDETPRGRYHRVEPGETAATIAAAYGLSSQWAVYDANPSIAHPDRPPVGAWLYIPHPSVAPAARPRPGQPGWSETPSGTAIVDGVWLQLAACESSGNWAINTGNGYYGGLQFTLDSWRFVGGAGKPHEAHPMEQIARAEYLQRIQGWKAWPLCAEKLGLLAPGEGQAQVDRARAAGS